jgi:tellurite resistance-related uncharacterized protein
MSIGNGQSCKPGNAENEQTKPAYRIKQHNVLVQVRRAKEFQKHRFNQKMETWLKHDIMKGIMQVRECSEAEAVAFLQKKKLFWE